MTRRGALGGMAGAAALFILAAVARFSQVMVMTYFDTKSYRAIADSPVASRAFWLGSRPPFVSLMLKLSGSDERFTWLQLGAHLLATLALAAAAARWLTSWRMRCLGFTTILV